MSRHVAQLKWILIVQYNENQKEVEIDLQVIKYNQNGCFLCIMTSENERIVI